MKLTLRTDLTVEDLCKGFVYNEVEGKGLYGWEGRLTIQPEYQRNYIYGDGRRYVVGNPLFLWRFAREGRLNAERQF